MNYHTIAIDCDDVIVETGSLLIKHYNKTYSTKLELKDLYTIDAALWGAPSLDVVNARVQAYLSTEEFQHTAPLQEAIEATRLLSKHFDLHLITGRADVLEQATKDLLKNYFPDIFRSATLTGILTDKKRDKADVCRELDIDLLIDDYLVNAEQVAACGIDVLLFGDFPWNQAERLPDNIRRVRDWEEVINLLLPDQN